MRRITYEEAPNDFGDTWKLYVEHHIVPGSFGSALLCNDLKMATMCADHLNIRLIGEHVTWMINNLPEECWGSPEAYERWVTPAYLGHFRD
jgi:hypothetical protein